MIFYSEGPSINLVNSFYEKDILKKMPCDYALNLLTLDKNKQETNKKIESSDIGMNNIHRGLINLFSYETEPSFLPEKKEEDINQLDLNNKNNNLNSKNNSSEQLMNPKKEINGSSINNNNIYSYDKETHFKYLANNNDENNIKNENSKYNINQNICDSFNIPNINFIYNIGINYINNQIPNNNNNLVNNDVNKEFEYNNINNVNNDNINIDSNIIKNLDNQSHNNNNECYKDYLVNNNFLNNQSNRNVNREMFYTMFNKNNINNPNFFGMKNNNFDNKNMKNKFKINSSKENKYFNMNLQEITNKLDIIAKKKYGCKFLENFLKSKENNSEIINKIFYPKLYWVKLYELCNDLFGNYFIQALIPKLNDDNLISFTNLIVNNLLNLCLNPHGTRVVQILINNIKDNKFNLLLLFKNSLSQIMDKIINNLNGSFVLMHYAKEIQDNDIIYDFLNKNIVEIATNSYSCSALQKLIDIANNQQRQKLLIYIINNTNNLVGNQCGLYVLQFIMSKNNYYINDSIAEQIINKIIYYSKKKYSSNVIEKCLETCSPDMVNKIINLLNKEKIIRDLTVDIFGNYVIQKLLAVCTNSEIKNQILGYIALEFKNLKNISFGPKLMDKINMSYPQIKKYL